MINSKLKYYLEHGYLNKFWGLLAIPFPSLISLLSSKFISLKNSKPFQETNNKITVSLDPYIGNLNNLNAIIEIIHTFKSKSVYAAIVHGSIATDEIINYSDFDGILILDDSELKTSKDLASLRKLIKTTQEEMIKFDSLQHHGWQILLKGELNNFNEAKTPLTLFNHGKILYPKIKLDLCFEIINTPYEYKKGFHNLKLSINKKLQNQDYNKSFYNFKNFISEILLVPTLYYQALNNESIFKRDSFKWITNHLNEQQNKFISEVSDLRIKWVQEEALYENEIIANRLKKIKPLSILFRTKIPDRYKNWFDNTKKDILISILDNMNEKINQTAKSSIDTIN